MNREPIYAALYALVSAATGLTTSSRKLKHWDDVQASAMPALFQAQAGQEAMITAGMLPTRWLLGATLWLYVSTDGIDNPGLAVNAIVDSITGMLAWQPGVTKQTLGGLVEWARIEGNIETSEGTLGTVEAVRIPVKILVTG